MKSDTYPNTWFNPTEAEMEDAGLIVPIAFDMDGVLSETGSILESEIMRRFNVKSVRDPSVPYETFQYVIPGVSNLTVFDTINDIIRTDSLSALPSPWMQEVLGYWYDVTDNMALTVVTARVQDNMEVTYQWLEQYINGPFNLIMVNGMQKEVVLKRIKNSIFIDDRYKTVKTLTNHISLPVLYKRQWNQGRPDVASPYQINDLRDLIPLFNLSFGRDLMAWPRHIPYPNRIGEKGKYLDLYA